MTGGKTENLSDSDSFGIPLKYLGKAWDTCLNIEALGDLNSETCWENTPKTIQNHGQKSRHVSNMAIWSFNFSWHVGLAGTQPQDWRFQLVSASFFLPLEDKNLTFDYLSRACRFKKIIHARRVGMETWFPTKWSQCNHAELRLRTDSNILSKLSKQRIISHLMK